MNHNYNNINSSILLSNESSNTISLSKSSISVFIELPFILLTIIFAMFYVILIIIRPTFRRNKLNWFTVNVCIASVLLSINVLSMNIGRQFNVPNYIPCRVQGFLIIMSASQLMYSHCVVSFSRLLTIVYASKHFFRTKLCVWTCIGFGWLFALLVSLIYLFVDGFLCLTLTKSRFLPFYTLFTNLILPAIIVAVCNIRILWHVRRSSRQTHATNGKKRGCYIRDIRLVKIMIISFGIVFTGWVPIILLQTFALYTLMNSSLGVYFQILLSLTMLHGVLFLIYTNPPVRLFIKQIVVKRYRNIQYSTVFITIQHNIHLISNR
ncbi:unnamed protein product [Adineta steineri]|uniref:G-protein coupled receptors family 1 profile domain-containing protein n=1 Tax=Adineta steineri TaxID=433720 RepID=A0A816C2Z2_9BILA|nr:unnamed protein product [Adineta steineri]CAF1618623.1 unnamed protein product [Adineta steineri]